MPILLSLALHHIGTNNRRGAFYWMGSRPPDFHFSGDNYCVGEFKLTLPSCLNPSVLMSPIANVQVSLH